VAEQRRAKLKERLEAAMRFMRAHLLPDKAATAPAEKPAKN